MALSLSTSSRNGISILAASGAIDVQTAPELREALNAMLSGGATSIAVDLGGVEFLDSSALGALVGANKRMGEGNALWIVCSQPKLLRLFEITRLTQAFSIVASIDDIRR